MTFDPTRNRPEIDINAEAVERLAYMLMATPDHHYQGHGQTAALKMRALRATLDASEARAVVVKPMDLSNMLKHAFIAGRISAGASSSFHGHAWAEYDPTESAAYARILSALHPASPLGAVKVTDEMVNRAIEAFDTCDALPTDEGDFDAMKAALTAALAPFARKGE